jgi:hypothetical protein
MKMGPSKYLRGLCVSLAAAGLALTMGIGTARADVVNGFGGCAWTPPDSGCSYVAATNLGTVAWVGGGTPQVTASGQPICVGTAACASSVTCVSVSATAGACTFEQTGGAPVAVSVPGSTAGVAGTPVPGISQGGPGNCVWSAGSGGCSFPARVTGATQVFVAWVNGAAPLVNGQAPYFCPAAVGTQGVCGYFVNAVAGATVTVTADISSTGAASEQDTI